MRLRGPGLPRPAAGALAGLLLSLLIGGSWLAGAFGRIERFAYDQYQVLRARLAVGEPFADLRTEPLVVAIDDQALQAIGPWPWPRETYARLIDRLVEAGAGAIGFDVLLPDPAPEPMSDIALAEALQRAGRVSIAAVPTVVAIGEERQPAIQLEAPFPLLVAAARSVGHVAVTRENDGAVRRLLVRVAVGEAAGEPTAAPRPEGAQRQPTAVRPAVPALALALARLQSGRDLQSAQIPTLLGGYMLLSYRRPQLAPTVSAAEFLKEGPGAVLPQLGGRPVLVGVTAAGLRDIERYLLPLPGLEQVPDVYVQAVAVRQILRQDYIRPAPRWTAIAALGVVALLCGPLLFSLRPLAGAGVALALAAGLIGAGTALFVRRGVLVEPLPAALGALAVYIAAIAHGYFRHERESARLKATFRRYMAPEVVDQILANPAQAALQRRCVTILFADVRGFTAFAAQAPPDVVLWVLNRCREAMAQAILGEQGTLDKFIGDGVMGIFGAPVARSDHESAALRSALAMQGRFTALAREFERRGVEPPHIGIGVHAGEVIVGSIGGEERLEYTAIGDTVNVAARLGDLAAAGEILATEAVRQAVGPVMPFAWTPLSPVIVRGKKEPMAVFAVGDAGESRSFVKRLG